MEVTSAGWTMAEGNMTAAGQPAEEEIPLWSLIMNNVQNTTNIIGIIANTMTLITLIKNSDGFSEIICLLLKYQSAIDASVCLCGLLFNILPPFWRVGQYELDVFICHIWHSSFVIWFVIAVSIWNLVTLAIERYICICHPIRYTLLTKGKVRLIIAFFFCYSIFQISCTAMQARMDGDVCVPEFINETALVSTIMAVYAIACFFNYYAIPTTLFIILYGQVINSFRQRAKMSLGASGTASVIDKATSELTKTSIVVTIIFVISYSWDAWYYVLGYVGAFEYIVGGPYHRIGMFLAIFNCVVNPFVYASLMPVYRRSVKKTFTCSKE